MCDPVSLTVTAVVLAGAGTGVSAYGQYKQGQYQKDMANYQASLQRQRGVLAQKMGEAEAAEAEKRHRQLIGSGLASFAGNGVLLESRAGSAAAMWEVDQNKELAYEKEKIRSNAELEAWGFKTNASALRSEGSNAAWAGNMGAAGTVLSGAGSMAAMGGMASSYSGGGASGSGKYMSGSNATGGWSSGSSASASIA